MTLLSEFQVSSNLQSTVGGEISVCVLACLLVCLYPSDFARELEVKCSRGQVRITADSKSRSHRFDTGK